MGGCMRAHIIRHFLRLAHRRAAQRGRAGRGVVAAAADVRALPRRVKRAGGAGRGEGSESGPASSQALRSCYGMPPSNPQAVFVHQARARGDRQRPHGLHQLCQFGARWPRGERGASIKPSRAGCSVKVTGLAQKLGQLDTVNRDLQSKSWANLLLLGQFCHFRTCAPSA